ncbi:hypothetical protein Leryth_015411 [Lithospermum erythrorhizon]|uniref:Transmembrane protein n=1 Tax=Lithospermum erythrorhizon TaxID=34254 RepID=A0AAV3RNW3_LITER|nr:hypothetical protein Leryth_015411 [Lithospermum erythrorhizon]
MVAPGNVKGANVQAPPPHGQYRQPRMKAAGAVTPTFGMPITPTMGNQTSPKLPSATQNTEVLHQTKNKLPYSPVRMGIVGFGAAFGIFYFALYTYKKQEVTAIDVARVATGTATHENTHPRNRADKK